MYTWVYFYYTAPTCFGILLYEQYYQIVTRSFSIDCCTQRVTSAMVHDYNYLIWRQQGVFSIWRVAARSWAGNPSLHDKAEFPWQKWPFNIWNQASVLSAMNCGQSLAVYTHVGTWPRYCATKNKIPQLLVPSKCRAVLPTVRVHCVDTPEWMHELWLASSALSSSSASLLMTCVP